MKNSKKLIMLLIAASSMLLLQNCKKLTEEDPSCLFPATITVANITNTSLDVSWVAAETAEQYILQYRKQGTTAWTDIRVTSGLTTSVANLAAGTTYEYHVQANCSGSNSTYSAIVTFKTLTDKEFNIVKKWRMKFFKEDNVEKALGTSDFIEFKKDFTLAQSYTGATASGTWVFVSNQDSVTVTAGVSKTWKIKSLTTSEILLTKPGASSFTDSLRMEPF